MSAQKAIAEGWIDERQRPLIILNSKLAILALIDTGSELEFLTDAINAERLGIGPVRFLDSDIETIRGIGGHLTSVRVGRIAVEWNGAQRELTAHILPAGELFDHQEPFAPIAIVGCSFFSRQKLTLDFRSKLVSIE